MARVKMNRRGFLKVAGAGALTLGGPGLWVSLLRGESKVPEIAIRSDYAIGHWYYDPIGLWVEPGQTVRWRCTKWGATVTAFHPANDNHELRIPENATPFDSGLLGDGVNTTFEWTFQQEGTYDYYSRNHEVLGLIGRIVVGTPGGPGEKPLGYGAREGRSVTYKDMARIFQVLNSEEIVRKKSVPYPREILRRSFPLH